LAFSLFPSIDSFDEDQFPKPVNKVLMKTFKVIVLIITAVTARFPGCGKQEMVPMLRFLLIN
jgi:hypothetical protein